MADICVFYAGEDRKAVKGLVATLEKRFSVWWDRKVGDGVWSAHVEAELAKAKVAIVVWSQASIQKEIVLAEAARTIRRKKPLLMLRLEPVEVPLQFSQRSTVDAFGWDGIQPSDAIDELISKVEGIVAGSSESRSNRPMTMLLAGKNVQLPGFLRSVSSFETQIPPYACLEILDLHETDLVLMSAYDMHSIRPKRKALGLLSSMSSRGSLVVMDSGNYEAYRRKDFADGDNPDGWSREKYVTAVKSIPFDMAFCFDNFRTGARPEVVINDVVEATRRDQAIRPKKTICPIVHAPTDRGGRRRHEMLPEIIAAVSVELKPAVIAVPERELGDGILERARSVYEIRRQLRKLNSYQPLHLLGTGNPWSIAVLSCAGADLFDGLEWCRTTASDESGELFHFQHYDLFRYQARLAGSDVTRKSVDNARIPFVAKVAFHNLEVINNWMKKLQEYSAKGSAKTFLAQRLGRQFDDLREQLPEIFA
jgi:queuine/archaeosine tRNA-ribosyltransferase